jgi:hypothetical protein
MPLLVTFAWASDRIWRTTMSCLLRCCCADLAGATPYAAHFLLLLNLVDGGEGVDPHPWEL